MRLKQGISDFFETPTTKNNVHYWFTKSNSDGAIVCKLKRGPPCIELRFVFRHNNGAGVDIFKRTNRYINIDRDGWQALCNYEKDIISLLCEMELAKPHVPAMASLITQQIPSDVTDLKEYIQTKLNSAEIIENFNKIHENSCSNAELVYQMCTEDLCILKKHFDR